MGVVCGKVGRLQRVPTSSHNGLCSFGRLALESDICQPQLYSRDVLIIFSRSETAALIELFKEPASCLEVLCVCPAVSAAKEARNSKDRCGGEEKLGFEVVQDGKGAMDPRFGQEMVGMPRALNTFLGDSVCALRDTRVECYCGVFLRISIAAENMQQYWPGCNNDTLCLSIPVPRSNGKYLPD